MSGRWTGLGDPVPRSVGLPHQGPAVVAMGGGHGLFASLRALHRVTDDLTAVVGVSDDGGSSGRLRAELGVVPPGDLRMALAALCGDDVWGRTWSQVMQHRFGGSGELRGHSTGNIIISALWEETGNVVEGLDWMAALLRAHGRVLPVANVPLDLVATVAGMVEGDPDAITEVRGQEQVAHAGGRVIDSWIEPSEPAVCPEAATAVSGADVIVLGPGSWYTSVLTHFQVPGLREAFVESGAMKILVLNLDAEPGETSGFAADTYLTVLAERVPEVRLDFVLADESCADEASTGENGPLARACEAVGAELVFERLAAIGPEGLPTSRHDTDLLAAALGTLVGRGSITAWQ